jgi:hypothetical protein
MDRVFNLPFCHNFERGTIVAKEKLTLSINVYCHFDINTWWHC